MSRNPITVTLPEAPVDLLIRLYYAVRVAAAPADAAAMHALLPPQVRVTIAGDDQHAASVASIEALNAYRTEGAKRD